MLGSYDLPYFSVYNAPFRLKCHKKQEGCYTMVILNVAFIVLPF